MPRSIYHNYRVLHHDMYRKADFEPFKDDANPNAVCIEMLLVAWDKDEVPYFWIITKRVKPGSETPITDIMASFKFPTKDARNQADAIKYLQTDKHLQEFVTYPFYVSALDCLMNYLTPEKLEELRQGIVVTEDQMAVADKDRKMKEAFARLQEEAEQSAHGQEVKDGE